jgi:hypothetical protein
MAPVFTTARGAGMGLALGLAILAVGAGPAAANPAEDAYKHKDYATALQLWRKAAQSGDALAAFNIGQMNFDGLGVPVDHAAGARAFRAAADLGLSAAHTRLGVLYAKGDGLPMDMAKAASCWRLGAAAGDPVAALNLGAAYNNGQGVRRNVVFAYLWIGVARRMSKPDAQVHQQAEAALAKLKPQIPSGQLASADANVAQWMVRARAPGDRSMVVVRARSDATKAVPWKAALIARGATGGEVELDCT